MTRGDESGAPLAPTGSTAIGNQTAAGPCQHERTLLEALAEAIARKAHAGQREPYGRQRDYIEHVAAVVALVSGEDEKAVAWLHDVVEDTDVDLLDLVERGMPTRLVRSVERLSRLDKDEAYRHYIARLSASGDAVAIAVKVADLREHLHPSCPDRLRPRYEAALRVLTGDGNQQPCHSAVDPVADRGQTGSTRDSSEVLSSQSLLASQEAEIARLTTETAAVLRRAESAESDWQAAEAALASLIEQVRTLRGKWSRALDEHDAWKPGQPMKLSNDEAGQLDECLEELDTLLASVGETGVGRQA